VKLLDDRTPEDLTAWSHAWVEEAGRPGISTTMTLDGARVGTLTVRQQDPYPRRGLTWNQELQLVLGYADRIETFAVRLRDASVQVPAAAGRPAPLYLLPTGGGVGYGDVQLDGGSIATIVQLLPDIRDPMTRASAWITLWDAMLRGEIDPPSMLDLSLRALPRETDELNVQAVLGYLSATYWRFSTPQQRDMMAARVEASLKAGLAAAPTTTGKAAYFAALRGTALTEPTLTWLRRIWRHDEAVPGLTLSEADDIQLAEELAVRGVPDADAMVAQQIERTSNPDRKARLAFVAPALSADRRRRDEFFRSLAARANREHEAWVLEGVRYLNHPLRARDAEAHIGPSLELLQDIQRTGDIFFPKRWMDATLGGHSSPAAAATVRSFLASRPAAYPERLRRIILSSADDLFRAAKIVQ
jgi:aminopeptidase N